MGSKIEKYILLIKSIHLGNIKDTFGRGAVIEYNPANQAVRIDGRICENGSKDIELLKSQAMKNPSKPWICMYSDEALADIRGNSSQSEPTIPQHIPKHQKMNVIQSDEDSHQTIDISHTQVSKIKQAEKEAERARKKTGNMPVIQGHQTVEDRIAELKDKKSTDLSARAERVRLMTSKKADMPIVRDDSLGAHGGGNASPMNAGSIVGGRRADEVPEHVSSSANNRKAEVANNRKKSAQDEFGFDPDQAGIDEIGASPDDFAETVAPTPIEDEIEVELEEAVPDAKDEEIARLKAQLAQAESSQKVANPEPKTPKRPVKKTPVTKES